MKYAKCISDFLEQRPITIPSLVPAILFLGIRAN